MSITPALLDLQQTAAYLQISERAVERRTGQGRLPGFRKLFQTQARWSREVLTEWIRSGCPDVDAEQFENELRQRPPTAGSHIDTDATTDTMPTTMARISER